MARSRIPIGTFGSINTTKNGPRSWTARARFRDPDGVLRPVEATSAGSETAEQELKIKLAHRTRIVAGVSDLHPHSPFSELVQVWLEDLDLDPDLAQGTKDLYERDMRTLVLPAFEHFVLREITISKVDRFLRTLAHQSYSRAKHAKVVLNLALGMAHRYEAIEKNPVTGTKRLKRPVTQATALSLEEIQAIRAAARTWRRGDTKTPGPKPDGQLEVIIEVMLGSSLRIGEVLALRKCDIDLTTTPATLQVSGTIVSPKGKPTYRQPHPKTRTSVRRIAIPTYTATALRDRMVDLAGHEPDTLVFRTRNGTPLTTNNIRRRLRDVLATAGITGVTPHSFRRTVATTINRAAGADLAAQLLGHTSSEITQKHYIEPDTNIDTRTATIFETLTPGSSHRAGSRSAGSQPPTARP
ncbi:tyrosine-type recombinase/integrase [Promicromonospora sukumoe]|uniref:Integrase n=1 Tax=Promicromonospora sukumoe TaxID=88382 RepID=A0A7W3J7I4_9MICO|nr:site-specific integrase [Promicromonospora sukumoe]MBA8807706.1 integrase [Promicromonospora sukumoe]